MTKCRLCDHPNPAGVDRCEKCGTWIDSQGEQPAQTPSDPETAPPDEFEAQLLAELQAGRKIPAVKLYREKTRVGLKEAKDAVEQLAAKHGVTSQGGGCAGVLLLAVASAGLAAVLFDCLC